MKFKIIECIAPNNYRVEVDGQEQIVAVRGQRDAMEEILETLTESAHVQEPNYADMRRAAYPPIGDQLDALWKGGAEADAMRLKIEAVKLKYPKPLAK